jgi:hypothetical protein
VDKMDDIQQMLKQVSKQRNRVIIFHERCLEQVKDDLRVNEIKLIDISLKLAELLSSSTKEEKSHEAWDILCNWLENQNSKVLALFNIDYMFSPEVGTLDPIHNFNYYSRDKQIIILFIRAKRDSNHLEYSEEGRPDYNRMNISNNEYVLGW